jgi:hypothetical protein
VSDSSRWRPDIRAGSLTFALRDSLKELYSQCVMSSNNGDWEKGWFYLCNDCADLPPTPERC